MDISAPQNPEVQYFGSKMMENEPKTAVPSPAKAKQTVIYLNQYMK